MLSAISGGLLKSSGRTSLLFAKRKLWRFLTCAELDTQYLCDEKNMDEISVNISIRKGIGDIGLVHQLKKELDAIDTKDDLYETTKLDLHSELLKIPNRTHPDVANYGSTPKTIKQVGTKRQHENPLKDFQEIVKRLKLVRTDQLGNLAGSKSYYLLGEMAELEQALVQYVISALIQSKFQLVSVPDILHRNVVESCGMSTKGARTQVYALDPHLHEPDMCLSGTSEIALAGFLAGKILSSRELPKKLVAVSRCYRAETSNLLQERGLYRVHEFTKVEMFIVSTPDESSQILEEIRETQENFFERLGLHFVVLDMPPHELGAQAYRKYDVEAWMPGRKMYGEISSCSNCLDYQARRLGIKYDKEENLEYVHTLNGTACAVPRLLIALVESEQNSDGTISIPEVLQKYMRGKSVIRKQKYIPDLKLIKNKKYDCVT